MKKILLILTLLIPLSGITQDDSLKFKDYQLKKVGANYYNYSDVEKFNFEVVVWGGVRNPGVYLIPEGTTLITLISLTGSATDESIYEDFKLIRTTQKSGTLKSDSAYVINYKDLFDKDVKGKINKPNPILQPGDILVFSIKPEKDFWEIAQRVAGIFIVPLLTLASLTLQIINLSK